MPTLTMPNIGEGVAEGTVVRWLKAEGDAVRRDEPLVEVETDKAVVEVPSPFEGRLARIIVQADQVVPIGAPLAEFELVGGAEPAVQAPAAAPAQPQPPPAAPAATAPAQPQPAPAAPERREPAPAASAPPRPAAPAVPPGGEFQRTPWYSPVVLKLAAEHGIDLGQVNGSGVGGRVTRRDVLSYLQEGNVGASAPSEAAAPPAPPREPEPGAPAVEPAAPAEGVAGAEDEVVPLTATRRTIAARMAEAHRTTPVAWMAIEADVTGLVALRERAKEEFQRKEGVALTYLPFLVEAIVGALKEHPALNATYGEQGITLHRRYHIGLAVATPAGLLVPVIRDADRKSVAGLAGEIAALAERARDRRLTFEELQGGTFTINNTGAFGSMLSQPIIPPGQAAIINTEVIRRELRVLDDGTFAVRSVMNLCLSFDHRALDGADAGRFLQTVKARLEAFRPDQAVY